MHKRLTITAPDTEQPPAAESIDNKLLWRPETVASKLDIAVGTLYRWRNSGTFPEPDLRMGPKLMWWKPETVARWIIARAGGRDGSH